ncbi:hypothetical protein BH23CYA1_BH23CYA1_22570 [soil metagenome]
MNHKHTRREVSRVLDSKPRIFSLPTAVIVPAMFIVVAVGMTAYTMKLPGYMILLSVTVFLTGYFFLFGQEWWRLVSKFGNPPRWVRTDVLAMRFTLVRNEKKTKGRAAARSR